jgi:transcriptional regulator with XRE-family HTH domain
MNKNRTHKELGRIIKKYRIRNNHSQADIEMYLGMSKGTLCRLEAGQRGSDLHRIIIIANFLGFSLKELQDSLK